MFTRILASVKFMRMYTCTRCGAQQQGSTEHISIEADSTEKLRVVAEDIPPNPRCMPVGWASFTDGVRCPECITERQPWSVVRR